MKMVLVIVTVIVFAQTALASKNPLLGTWKYKEGRCSSGAQYNFGKNAHIGAYLVDYAILIEETQMFASLDVTADFDAQYLKDLEQTIKEAFATADKMVNNSAKQEFLKKVGEAQKSLVNLQRGIRCHINSVGDYTLSGNVIEGFERVSSSACTKTNKEKKVDRHEYAVDEKSLTIKDLKPVEDDGTLCPKGDNMIMVFERI